MFALLEIIYEVTIGESLTMQHPGPLIASVSSTPLPLWRPYPTHRKRGARDISMYSGQGSGLAMHA